jgi:4-hydroxy-3-methylbut-2-enyl diphosphate reductase
VLAAPLRVEAAALSAGLRGRPRGRGPQVIRTGGGQWPAHAGALHPSSGPVVVAGVCGALTDDLLPGDLVVASEVRGADGRVRPCLPAPLLVASLRAAGLRVHLGPIVVTPGLVHGRAERARLAAQGALAVDLESAALLDTLAGRPAAVVRAVVDTPSRPLRRLGTAGRGVQALRSLARAAPVLAAWTQLDIRAVLVAEPRAFCAGVERAIATVERVLDSEPHPVYVRRQIVHNTHVVAGLEDRGAVFVSELDEVPPGATVVLSAHGVAPTVRAEAAARSLRVVDATCPLVAKVHTEARRAAELGDVVVLIGHPDHEEVVGTRGEAPDSTVVVSTPQDVDALDLPAGAHISYLMQTTLALDEAGAVAARLVARFPGAQGPPSQDICYATSNRQAAVSRTAAGADVVLVLGSSNSSNSRRLVEVAERGGAPAHLVEDVGSIRLEWLTGAQRVGVTAGASAPPHLVDDLVEALSAMGPVEVSTVSVGREHVAFELPKEVRYP